MYVRCTYSYEYVCVLVWKCVWMSQFVKSISYGIEFYWMWSLVFVVYFISLITKRPTIHNESSIRCWVVILNTMCVWLETIWFLYWFNVFIFGAIALFEIEMRSSVGRLFFSCNYYCALIFWLQTYEHMLICMHAAREKGRNREFYISRRRINALSFILHTILCCFGVKFQCASSALQIYM